MVASEEKSEKVQEAATGEHDQCVKCCTCRLRPPGGTLSAVPACLQLTEDDLEATKLDPKEVFTFKCVSTCQLQTTSVSTLFTMSVSTGR